VHADRAFGATVCALSLAFLIFGVPTISDDWMRAAGAQYFTVGPRLFPYLAGGCCLLLGLWIALGRRPAGAAGAFLSDGGVRRRTIGLAALCVGYAALLEPLGFVPSTSVSMILFILLSQQYLRLFHPVRPHRLHRVSLTRIFASPLATVIGMHYLYLSTQLGIGGALWYTLGGVLGIAIITFMYFQEFDEHVA